MKSFFKSLGKYKLTLLAVLSVLAFFGGSLYFIDQSSPAQAEGRDCKSNSIIVCGSYSRSELSSDYNGLDYKGRAAFAHAGVNPSKFGQTVEGYVTRDNRVVVNGKTVATNVYTYGRGNMAGSTQINGGAYMRQPSVSFRQNSLSAYVHIENGVFKWAVLKSCGNPVKGNPTFVPKPGQAIQKKVNTDLKASPDAAYFYGKESVKVAPGTTVRFITMASNTGNTNISGAVWDEVPGGTSFVKGTYQLKENGRTIKTGNLAQFPTKTHYGWIGTLKPGAEVKIDVWVKYNTTKKVRNIACIDTNELPKYCDDAYVEPPQAACVSLKATKLDADTVRFDGRGSVTEGAKINAYYFKPSLSPSIPSQIVRTGNTSASTTYTYANPGTYTAQLTLDTNVGNRSGEQCKVTVKVEEPKKPGFEVDKTIRKSGTNDPFVEIITVEPSTEVEYKIDVINTGETELKGTVVRDYLPANVTYVNDSLRLNGQVVTNDESFFTNAGVVVPSIPVGGKATFTFKAKAPSVQTGNLPECKDGKKLFKNWGWANPIGIGGGLDPKKDDADLETCKEKEKKPNFTIDKTVRKDANDAWVEDVTVEPEEEYEYRVRVTNTGETELKNVVIKDVLPTGVTYVDNSLRVDGQSVNNDNDFFGSGITVSTLAVGDTVTITMKVKAPSVQTGNLPECKDGKKNFNNVAKANPEGSGSGLDEKEDDADAKSCYEKEVEPKFACVDLTKTIVDNDEVLPLNVRFNAQATASDGAVIQGYIWNFGDGSQTIETNGPAVTHSYTTAGNYTATVRVRTNAGTTAVTAACSVPVTVNPDEAEFNCKDLTATPMKGQAPLAVTFTATGEVENAEIEDYTFNFGDGSAAATSEDNVETHTYTEAGNYTANVVINTSEGSTNPNDCKVSIIVNAEPVCPYNPELPANHPDCEKPEEPVCPYNPELPADHKDCEKPEEPVTPDEPAKPQMPAILPKTGPAQTAVALGGMGAIFGAARMYVSSRREVIRSILKK